MGVYRWPAGRTYEGYFENGKIQRVETKPQTGTGTATDTTGIPAVTTEPAVTG